MKKAVNSCLALALVATLCVAVVAQQNAAMLYASGAVTLNGAAVTHESSVLVPGDRIATGSKAIGEISVPGAAKETVKLGQGSSIVYKNKAVELKAGKVLLASSGHSAVQFEGLTISTPSSGEFVVTTTPSPSVNCLKGTCTVAKGASMVTLNAGQALLAQNVGGKQQGNAGTQASKNLPSGGQPGGTGGASAFAGGIPGWVIGVIVAGAAAGIGVGVWASQRGDHASPSVP